ncbi:hypothetical protein [Breoghania sp.]|uniref:hypothetical protein n=1 Tax=Breoghania sp. TaxID=2065378 RepID=UPI00260BF2B1|nr:hypothetical protein [Breoghania sp.]MDJ0930564.1 hypothetical protein [Breoghania sp.]
MSRNVTGHARIVEEQSGGEWGLSTQCTTVTDYGVARKVARSTGFDVVDMPKYYRDMAEMTGLQLDAITWIVNCIPFFAHGERHLLLRRVIVEVFKKTRIGEWQWLIDEEVDRAPANLAKAGASG